MRYASTRDPGLRASFSEAIALGLAPDGGLFVPAEWPRVDAAVLSGAPSLSDLSARFLAPFVAGDELAPDIDAIVREAFDFPVPLVRLSTAPPLFVLELFHGPTAAFKDFGARFLAAAFARLRRRASRPLRILVATSGDTGGAVAAAFHRRPGILVAILFPKGRVSPTQERQLTTWGENVQALSVRGSFDDCQRMVKEAFVDPKLRAESDLSSANSINLGRLLPQAVYYAWTSLAIQREHGAPASFVIPSGNLGNAMACAYARASGLPIRNIVMAHNANRAVPDYLASGTWEPRASVPTLASAMDVGDPSNLERLRALYPKIEALRAAITAASVDDDAIARRIHLDFERRGRAWCPHSAAAAEAYERLPKALRESGPWVIVATAHPAKFREIVEPLIGRAVEEPPALARLGERPQDSVEIGPTLAELRAALVRT